MTQWAGLRRWGPGNAAVPEDWLPDKLVIPGSRVIAVTRRDLSAAAVQRGRPRPVNGTWTAACCLAHDLPLATLNLKNFKDFAGHHGLRLLEP